MPRQLPPARFGRRAAQFSCPRHPGASNAPDPDGEVCCRAYAKEIERAVDKAWRHEMAMEAGMGLGVDAYNDMMGQSTGSPGPCGHHCGSDCPRCGERNTGRRAKPEVEPNFREIMRQHGWREHEIDEVASFETHDGRLIMPPPSMKGLEWAAPHEAAHEAQSDPASTARLAARMKKAGLPNRGRRAKAKAKQPMTARRRGALLQKLGYEKLPFVMTRGTTTWVYKETRAKVTIVNGGKGDDPFQILGGPYGFTSAFLFVENMAPGTWSKLLQWQRSGEVNVPSFDHAAMMDAFTDNRWPQHKDIPAGWLDDLFVALVTSSGAAAKRLKLARVDWDGGKDGQANRGRRARLPLFIRRE